MTTELQKARAREASRRYRLRNREKVLSYLRQYYIDNIEKERVRARKKYAENQERSRIKNREHCKKYPAYWAAKAARRRASIKNATPPWAEIKEMLEFYKNCPIGHEVDHIIPLAGRNVCGLHVISNLQYLPISDNRRKNNRFSDIDAARLSV